MTSALHRFATPAAGTAAAALAAAYGVQLASYNVPLPPTVACAGCIFAVGFTSLHRAVKTWSSTTHRCTECDFTVRLRGADAAESRRWQEIAASHPGHIHRP
ncbi:hypothetical protein EYS09_24785 [Streptomyces kasugaensis]|uniref:Uncharacterized protein n=1 Tax=Streptomyces kasugaensis TaxID=1946 RepID=A0A4Q9HQ34_STRKA|nr:hypothetical protein [Streptomyces kasugaensis]TBO57022.1 hypothetical protein EYS09_24785 [Streptomyces kasugaensis]